MMRRCTHCGVSKLHIDFYQTGNGNNPRLHSWCRQCCTAAQLARRNANRVRGTPEPGLTVAVIQQALNW